MTTDEAIRGWGSSLPTVCVIGLGYIGLPTAAFIASKGISVTAVDIDEDLVKNINSSNYSFTEPGLQDLIQSSIAHGNLKVQTDLDSCDVYVIAVPTPLTKDSTPDTSYIHAAIKQLAPFLRPGALVILESTSPPGTTAAMAQLLIDDRPDLSLDGGSNTRIYVAHCPERVLPGRFIEEMERNDRVIGGLTPSAASLSRIFYGLFCLGNLHTTDSRTAEMTKLTENSFRDLNIAFANELSIICDKLNIDVWELISLANRHPRVNILQPGPGVGGHCIAVDPWFIVASAPNESNLIRTARTINDAQPDFVLDKVLELIKGKPNRVVAALGLTFKPDIDDLRGSPALSVVESLASNPDVDIRIVEPNIERLPESLRNSKNAIKQDLQKALGDADIILLLVDHKEFKRIKRSVLSDKQVIDTRGIWH